MTDKGTSWLDRLPLDAISIAVMVASMFLDGAYLRRFAYAGWFGLVCAYALNCVADLAVNKLTREFVRQWSRNLGKAKRVIVWALLGFALASFYFTTVFSWREASLQMPSEPGWLLWSIALFAPSVLAGLGIAEALRAKRPEATTSKTPSKVSEPVAVPALALPFQCDHCDRSFATQAAKNGHQSAHKRAPSNGHGVEVAEREAG